MPITVKHDVPKSLDVLLALQSGGAVGAAERGKEDRKAAREVAEMRQEMLFKAAQEEFRARQQAYRDQLQGQQEMMQQAVQGQQRMAQLQQQQQWQAQEGQRQTEQLQQQRKANRDAFLSTQISADEYHQADAALAARLAGLDPDADAKQRRQKMEEFQKRADPEDQRRLRGFDSRLTQIGMGVATGKIKREAAQGEWARMNQERDALIDLVQNKPDKSGPPLPEQWEKEVVVKQDPTTGATNYWSKDRNGAWRMVESKAQIEGQKGEMKLETEQRKAEVKAADEATKAQQKARDDYQTDLKAYNKQVREEAKDLEKADLDRLKDARKAWDAEHTTSEGKVTEPFQGVLRTFNQYRDEAINRLRMSGFNPPRPPQQPQRQAQPQGTPIIDQQTGEVVGFAPPERQMMPVDREPEQVAPQVTPQQIEQDMQQMDTQTALKNAPRVSSQEEYDRIPPGMPYIDARDGQLKIKRSR